MSIVLHRAVVDLNREFAPIPEHELEGGWRRALARMSGTVRHWNRLTQRAVVVLAEAGSGKTTEIAMRASSLRSTGCYAFALRLGEFSGTRQRVIGRDWAFFEEWLSTPDEGTFLLDALDEAKAAGYSLESLLETLTEWIGQACDRIRLVISSRPSEWEPVADAQCLRSVLRSWAPERDGDAD